VYVKSGDGLQFIDKDGDLQRWCLKHYKTLFQETKDAGSSEDQAATGNSGV
jgi:hypothetical protein